jgi:hypothetical protein
MSQFILGNGSISSGKRNKMNAYKKLKVYKNNKYPEQESF